MTATASGAVRYEVCSQVDPDDFVNLFFTVGGFDLPPVCRSSSGGVVVTPSQTTIAPGRAGSLCQAGRTAPKRAVRFRARPSNHRTARVDFAARICKHLCVHEIRFAAGVTQDLKRVRAYDRRRILDAIDEQLPSEATIPSRHRKLLINLVPPWTADAPIWELRVGEYRVFYDVAPEEGVVYVRAIRRKRTGKKTEDIL